MISLELLLNLISLQIGLENLSLNQKQVDGLNEHLSKQDNILEKEQNEMLKTIIKYQEEILKILKGGQK